MNKRAAIELSMGTIVVVVLSVSMLILGMILVRSIMCAGMQISEDISSGVRNEVKTLFGADNVGVKCMGEGGAEVKLGSGGRRKIICLIKVEEQSDYQLKVNEIKTIKGASQEIVNRWVLNSEWKGTVSPGVEKEADVVLLDIPRDAPTTTLRISIQATNLKSGSSETIFSTIDIIPTGFIRSSIC